MAQTPLHPLLNVQWRVAEEYGAKPNSDVWIITEPVKQHHLELVYSMVKAIPRELAEHIVRLHNCELKRAALYEAEMAKRTKENQQAIAGMKGIGHPNDLHAGNPVYDL